MTGKFAYFFVFIVTFVGVTAVMIALNYEYENIFNLNFSPSVPPVIIQESNTKVELTQKDFNYLRDFIKKGVNGVVIDSTLSKYIITRVDTFTKVVINDSSFISKLSSSKDTILTLQKSLNNKDNQIAALQKRFIQQEDSSYTAWVKSTAKLYETVDPKKSAKLISNHSDNEARDILNTIHKRKVAEIMAALSEETILRLTRKQ